MPNKNSFFSHEEKEEQPLLQSLIFSAGRPNEYYQKLKAHHKSWLLRESRINGMLTVDFWNKKDGRYHSMRFAFVPDDGGWQEVYGSQVDLYQAKMTAVRLDSEHLGASVEQLLVKISETLSLDQTDLLLPTAREQTRNSMYSCYCLLRNMPSENSTAIARQHLDEQQCPISLKKGDEIQEAVILFDQIYEREHIEKWVTKNNTCPLTRRPATLDDIRPTEIIQRLSSRLAQMSF